ncbi:hypothetical protein Tco_1009002 [Tanacetum coccineum]
MDDETTTDEKAYSSGEEVGRDHIPIVNLRQSWWKPLTEDRPASPEPPWTIPSSDLPVLTNNWASALKTTYVPPPENSLLAQTGDIATFMDWYCKRQVHLQFHMEECHKLFTDKVDDAVLQYNVSKPLPLGSEPDVGLEQLVLDQFWIEEECKYDIAAMYGISPWYFKYMYPSDFEDLYLLNLQGHLNHLSPDDKKLNLTKPRWDATRFKFKHDYTVIDSARAVTFRDRYGVQMIMRFNEIYKFSDDTLQQIDEALDYRVKEFKVNRTNPGMNIRFWTKKDVVRSKEFMFAI